MGGWNGLRPWMAAVLVSLVALIWLTTATFSLVDKNQVLGHASMQPVSAGHELVQTFKAPGDRISRIDLILNKPNPGQDGELRIQLVEASSTDNADTVILGKTLKEISLDTKTFDLSSRYSLDFELVDVIPGNSYAIRLTSDDLEETAVNPGGWEVNNYSRGRLFVDSEPTDADLYFALFHNTGVRETLGKMKPWRPYPLNRGFFVVGLFLIGAFAFGWLLRLVATDENEGQSEIKTGNGKGYPTSGEPSTTGAADDRMNQ